MEIIESNPYELNKKCIENEERKTGLFFPNMLINTHKGEVFSIDFSTNGQYIASSSFDMTIMIHKVYNECETINILTGHKNAVLQIKWLNDNIISCSADHNVCIWDIENSIKIKTYKEHTAIVNSIDYINSNLIVSCADDGQVKFWDFRIKKSVHTIKHEYPLIAICANNENVYVSCIDNIIKSYKNNTYELNNEFKGHTDYITSLAINKEENILASISSDQNIILWDIQPFSTNRLLYNLKGPKYNIDSNLIKLRFNNDNLLACGSGDNYLYIYDYKQKILKDTLPGHKSTINDVAFHPFEPIIASCSSDKTIFLGEL